MATVEELHRAISDLSTGSISQYGETFGDHQRYFANDVGGEGSVTLQERASNDAVLLMQTKATD